MNTSTKLSSKPATIAFTLPICCQICLGKVKQPVVCENQHVFCEPCMKVWLERSKQCPTCRIDISDDKPYKRVIGGLESIDGDQVESFSNKEVRRARIELLIRDYEAEIELLNDKLEHMENENQCLKRDLSLHSSKDGSYQDGLDTKYEEEKSLLLLMNNNLEKAHGEAEKWKKEHSKLKQKCQLLTDENINLGRENQRIRLEVANRSPMRFGRYTVAALQTKVETYEKQVKQLQKALERSDSYIEQIEKQLQVRNGHFTSDVNSDLNSFKRQRLEVEIAPADVAKKRLFMDYESSVGKAQMKWLCFKKKHFETDLSNVGHLKTNSVMKEEAGCSHWNKQDNGAEQQLATSSKEDITSPSTVVLPTSTVVSSSSGLISELTPELCLQTYNLTDQYRTTYNITKLSNFTTGNNEIQNSMPEFQTHLSDIRTSSESSSNVNCVSDVLSAPDDLGNSPRKKSPILISTASS